MWRTLSAELQKLGPTLQASQRGRGAQAAQKRKEQIIKIVEVSCDVHTLSCH